MTPETPTAPPLPLTTAAGCRRMLRTALAALPLLLAPQLPATAASADQVPPAPPPEQAAQYRAEAPKTIVERQQFRRGASAAVQGPDGRRGTATLVELNPHINAWFLLTLDWGGGAAGRAGYHLESPDPEGQRLRLAETQPTGLLISDRDGDHACDLWAGDPTPLDQARISALPFAPLCDGRLYLRNAVAGHRTNLERVTDFLRDHVWGGDAIVGLVRGGLFRDAYLDRSGARPSVGVAPGGPDPRGAPARASLNPAYAERLITPANLGIEVDGSGTGQLGPGRWYPVRDLPGAYVSVIQPQAVSASVLESHPGAANRLDGVEASALDYLVGFDLAAFDLGFALGTEHPRVGWSPRPPEAVRGGGLPGPDGIGTIAPLVGTGMVRPDLVAATVATFTGGFKREHGAFRYGPLAGRNRGSHYGFVEQGVVLSKLQPGLATLYVLDDGSIHMRTWSEADDGLLARMRFARQNGVPLVEPDPVTGAPAPGPLVAQWGPGNWSGSADSQLRTLRAGACLQETDAGRFLIYGYFSTATPSAMARVFQAYGCRYAMLLDMNALEHTYLAVYVHRDDGITVQHLIRGMEEVDQRVGGRLVPRFVGFPDNRDFFYLVRRGDRP